MSARSSSSARPVELHRPRPEALCELRGPTRRAVGHAEPLDAAGTEIRRGQLAHLARADEQDRPLVDVIEDAGGELGCSGGDGRRVLADARLAARALADVQRLAEEAVQNRTDGARVLGRLEGGPHLAEDLRLAGDEGVEPGGHAEEVKSGLPILLDVQRALELRARQARQRNERGDCLLACGLGVVRGDVEADTVAGRQGDRLAQRDGQSCGQLTRRHVVERESFPQLDRRVTVGRADEEKARHQRLTRG